MAEPESSHCSSDERTLSSRWLLTSDQANQLSCESTSRLLPFTFTIAICCYYSSWTLVLSHGGRRAQSTYLTAGKCCDFIVTMCYLMTLCRWFMIATKTVAAAKLQMRSGHGFQHPDGAFLVRPSDNNENDLSLTVRLACRSSYLLTYYLYLLVPSGA